MPREDRLQTVLRCHIAAFTALGGVPLEILTAAKVRAIMVRMGLPLRGLSLSTEIERREGELTVAELAHRLDRPLGTFYA